MAQPDTQQEQVEQPEAEGRSAVERAHARMRDARERHEADQRELNERVAVNRELAREEYDASERADVRDEHERQERLARLPAPEANAELGVDPHPDPLRGPSS